MHIYILKKGSTGSVTDERDEKPSYRLRLQEIVWVFSKNHMHFRQKCMQSLAKMYAIFFNDKSADDLTLC